MKKEWLANVKRDTKATSSAAAPTGAGRKRKVDEDSVGGAGTCSSKKIKVMVEIDMPDNVGPASRSSKAKDKKPVSKPTPQKKAADPASAPKPVKEKATKPTKEKKTRSKPPQAASTQTIPKSKANQTSSSSSPAKPKQTARRGGGFAGSTLSSRPQPQSFSSPDVKQSYNPADYHLSNPRFLDDPDTSGDDAPPPAYESHKFGSSSQSTAYYQNNHSEPRSTTVQVSGDYSLHTHYLSNQAIMTIQLDKTTTPHSPNNPALWAILEIEHKLRCVITTSTIPASQTPSFPSSALNGKNARVNYRCEDLESGQALFRRDCEGEIAFNGEGGVELMLWGCIDGRDLSIERVLDGGRAAGATSNFSLYQIKGEWAAVARRAYGRKG